MTFRPPVRIAECGHHTHRNNPNFEVFWADINTVLELNAATEGTAAGNSNLFTPGWYWWPCSPECLPDADPIGPFTTSAAAYNDATRE